MTHFDPHDSTERRRDADAEKWRRRGASAMHWLRTRPAESWLFFGVGVVVGLILS